MKRKAKHQKPLASNNRFESVSKSYKTFKTSWQVQTQLFFQHSTLHGVRYIAEKGRPFLEKFMWFACVAIGTVATAVIIVSLWEKFQTNPTITGLDTDFHNWDVAFPAITVCQNAPGNDSLIQAYIEQHAAEENADGASLDLSKFLTMLTKLTYDNVQAFKKDHVAKMQNSNFAKNINIKEMAFALMNRCEHMFVDCMWKGETFDCCDDFRPVFTERGFCYTFNSRHFEKKVPWLDKKFAPFQTKYIKETDAVWALNFTAIDSSSEIAIYILNSDELAGLDVEPQHIWDFKVHKMSFSVKQTYTTDDTKQLSIKQRHCVFSDEIKLAIDNIYTYTACTRQCRMDNAMEKCGCIPYFYPQIGRYLHCPLAKYECIASEVDKIKSVDQCACQLGCSNTVYELEKLNENLGDNNFLEIKFVSWPMVRYKREVLFGWVDLLVSFGGIAGLFLGFSLLSGVEIIYYFTLRTFCMIYKERDELERIQLEERNKPPIDYDLSLVPYFIATPLPGNGLNEMAKRYYHNNLGNNKIVPVRTKWNTKDSILPPFGIDFIN